MVYVLIYHKFIIPMYFTIFYLKSLLLYTSYQKSNCFQCVILYFSLFRLHVPIFLFNACNVFSVSMDSTAFYCMYVLFCKQIIREVSRSFLTSLFWGANYAVLLLPRLCALIGFHSFRHFCRGHSLWNVSFSRCL